MVWDFKQQLFTSQRKVSRQAVADLSNPAVRAKLQAHVDSLGRLPPAGAPDEYAALFEEVHPSEADRRVYLDAKIAGAKPSYGQLALATLMGAERTRLIWTTNFDMLVADACRIDLRRPTSWQSKDIPFHRGRNMGVDNLAGGSGLCYPHLNLGPRWCREDVSGYYQPPRRVHLNPAVQLSKGWGPPPSGLRGLAAGQGSQ